MRQLATLLLLAVAGVGSALAAAAPARGTTQIYQQRTADGRILLTDRPSAVATTERSWRLDAEDPVAARQRALDVRLEAQQVSERIQRHIEQQRRFDQEERLHLARLDVERAALDRDRDAVGGGSLLLAPASWRGRARFIDDRHDRGGRGSRPHAAPRGHRFTGPARPGSR